MTNITFDMGNILHGPLWEIMSLGSNVLSIKMEHLTRDKYVEPMEDFMYGLPYGASDLDTANSII